MFESDSATTATFIRLVTEPGEASNFVIVKVQVNGHSLSFCRSVYAKLTGLVHSVVDSSIISQYMYDVNTIKPRIHAGLFLLSFFKLCFEYIFC